MKEENIFKQSLNFEEKTKIDIQIVFLKYLQALELNCAMVR